MAKEGRVNKHIKKIDIITRDNKLNFFSCCFMVSLLIFLQVTFHLHNKNVEMEGDLFYTNKYQKSQGPIQVGHTVFPGGSLGSYDES